MGVTIKDLAEQAGVSTATVSRFLNNPTQVSSKKRDIIAAVIKELKYTPNDIARSLITKNSNTLGIILPDINNMFYPPIIRGIEEVADQNNYVSFFFNTDQNIRMEQKSIDVLLSRRVDGIMFVGTRSVNIEDNDHILALAKKLPVLMVYDDIDSEDTHCIRTDEVQGAYNTTKYLIDLGHRDIGFINSSAPYVTYKMKYEGYLKALKDYNIPLREEFVVSHDEHEAGGYRAACQLMECAELPTAICTASDQTAIGVMRAVLESGRSVPGDISVTGFGNTLISAQVYPRLTTVNQFGYNVGKRAAKKMIDMIGGRHTGNKKEILIPELVVRDSTAINSASYTAR